jgi:hypothetical protein
MQLHDRTVRVELARAAAHGSTRRDSPLLVEMELRFGCLVTKHVTFLDAPDDTPGIVISPGLYLDFRATAANACLSDSNNGDPANTVKPIRNFRPYVPNWCRIDYAGGRWSCEFGYERNLR